MIESKSFSGSTASSSASEDQGVQQSSDATKSDNALTDKQAEIQNLTELCGDLERKVIVTYTLILEAVVCLFFVLLNCICFTSVA